MNFLGNGQPGSMRISVPLVTILIVFFSGCQKGSLYDVPPEFQQYIDKFEEEAELRGNTYDIEKKGLKIEYASQDGYVGMCYYEVPVRIEFDKEKFDKLSESGKEFIVFHELGHGILNRKGHLNDTLPNGHWKSMMRGDPEDVSSHPLEYQPHRDYYLDELFDPGTPVPEWANLPGQCILGIRKKGPK
jgi:hypothetical protein